MHESIASMQDLKIICLRGEASRFYQAQLFIFEAAFTRPPPGLIQLLTGKAFCRFSFFFRQANAKSFSNIINLQKQLVPEQSLR
jgi:hypothetical protein